MKIVKPPTKQNIVKCAVDLFSEKGYTETSIRDIALAAGINPASLYFHFLSKEDLLLFILNDFANHTQTMFNNPDMVSALKEDHTAEGILKCMLLGFLILEDDYYLKVLHIIFQEQHRNDVFRDFVIKTILDIEEYVERIFVALKDLNVIANDADPDFWKKIISSMLYSFPSRIPLGIGHNSEEFTGMDIVDLLRYAFATILSLYGIG